MQAESKEWVSRNHVRPFQMSRTVFSLTLNLRCHYVRHRHRAMKKTARSEDRRATTAAFAAIVLVALVALERASLASFWW